MYQGYDPERIGIMPEYILVFIEIHNKDIKGARFKIGDKVLYKENIHEILAVNICDKDSIEYAISNHYYLVWEEELKSSKEK